MGLTVTTEGDAGDVIFCLSVVQELTGGPHTLLVKQSTVTTLRTPEAMERFVRVMKPLVEIQPYIKEFGIYDGRPIDWDSAGFRALGLHYTGISLLECHAQQLQMTKGIGGNLRGTRQWLYVEPSLETKGMVVVNRTSRYNNPFFPWQQIVNHCKGRILFLGLKHEWEVFCKQFGKVSWRQTADMLEMARLIAGSELFIGNQSSANAINEGLKHNLIQETCLYIPDCIFRRNNAQHVSDGGCILPNVSGSGEKIIPPTCTEKFVARTHITPPQGWQFEGRKSMAWNSLFNEVSRLPQFQGKSEDEVRSVILEANWKRVPHFFTDTSFKHQFGTFLKAHQTASSV